MFGSRRDAKCQPNFRQGVTPDASQSCGPYRPQGLGAAHQSKPTAPSWVSRLTHDTISVVAIDSEGKIAAGSSSNGANHKVSTEAATAMKKDLEYSMQTLISDSWLLLGMYAKGKTVV